MDEQGEGRPVEPAEPDDIGDPVHFAFLRPSEHGVVAGEVALVHVVLVVGEVSLQVGDAQLLVELLVEADDVHPIAAQGVDTHRAEDVVEHGVAVDVLVEELPHAELVVRLRPEARSVDEQLVAGQALEIIARHGAVEMVALHVTAPDAAQEVRLLGVLDALGDDGQAERFRHADRRLQNADALPLVVVVYAQEVHVELHDVHAHAVQHVERRVAAAEVVDEHGEALFAQALRRLVDLVGVVDVGRFSDLDLDRRGGHVVCVDEVLEVLRDVECVDVLTRDVHRYGHWRVPFVHPFADVDAHLFPQVAVEVGDEVELLEHGHEFVRLGDPAARLSPARERLGPDDLARRQAALRLQHEEDLAVREGFLELGEQAVLCVGLLVELAAEVADPVLEIALGGGHGELAAVEQVEHVALAFHHAHPEQRGEAQGDAGLRHDVRNGYVEVVHLGLRMGHEDAEIVLPEVAGEPAVLRLALGEEAADLRQHVIARFAPVPVVEELELLDVERDEAPSVELARGQELVRLLEELLLAAQVRQGVPLRGGVVAVPDQPELAQFAVLDVDHVEPYDAVREAELAPAYDHLPDPAPSAVLQPVPEFSAEDARYARVLQALHERVVVHERGLDAPVVGVNHVLAGVVVQLFERPVENGHEVLAVYVLQVEDSVVVQVDLYELVVGKRVQECGDRIGVAEKLKYILLCAHRVAPHV